MICTKSTAHVLSIQLQPNIAGKVSSRGTLQMPSLPRVTTPGLRLASRPISSSLNLRPSIALSRQDCVACLFFCALFSGGEVGFLTLDSASLSLQLILRLVPCFRRIATPASLSPHGSPQKGCCLARCMSWTFFDINIASHPDCCSRAFEALLPSSSSLHTSADPFYHI